MLWRNIFWAECFEAKLRRTDFNRAQSKEQELNHCEKIFWTSSKSRGGNWASQQLKALDQHWIWIEHAAIACIVFGTMLTDDFRQQFFGQAPAEEVVQQHRVVLPDVLDVSKCFGTDERKDVLEKLWFGLRMLCCYCSSFVSWLNLLYHYKIQLK